MTKYDGKGAFDDPVVRCDSCRELIKRERLREFGRCPFCGGKRMRPIDTLNSEEKAQLEKWEIDPDFFKLFEEVPNAD